jgi:hypothetical protein
MPCGASSIAHDFVRPVRPHGDHVRDHAAGDDPRALEVDVDHRVPLVLAELVREAVGADAGVVEQQVDPPEALDRGVDGG